MKKILTLSLLLLACTEEKKQEESNAIDITPASVKVWPFKTENARIWCIDGNAFVLTNGKTYGLNGSARTYLKEHNEDNNIDEIRITPNADISEVLEKTKGLCQ